MTSKIVSFCLDSNSANSKHSRGSGKNNATDIEWLV